MSSSRECIIVRVTSFKSVIFQELYLLRSNERKEYVTYLEATKEKNLFKAKLPPKIKFGMLGDRKNAIILIYN